MARATIGTKLGPPLKTQIHTYILRQTQIRTHIQRVIDKHKERHTYTHTLWCIDQTGAPQNIGPEIGFLCLIVFYLGKKELVGSLVAI